MTNDRTVTKTRNKTRDVDQIKEDLASPRHLAEFQSIKAPEDLPDLGRNYCKECARWFESDINLVAHTRGKPHKRMLKALREADIPDAAVGLRTPQLHVHQNGTRVAPDVENDVEMAT
ncbi:hypothetical protein G7046_g356 [Stylonectria norvegica]|nr:hypothetical protein G7046_g356 [Stylonectria norvegica]